ncbi:MAG: diaminopimelate epimerase [Balneolaceae bacterium]
MSDPLRFIKMQATGNDFVLIDNRHGHIRPDELADTARRLSHRKYGIGSDGLILLEKEPKGDGIIMHYKNPDGSDAGMCGNGARCFVRFARMLGYPDPTPFRVHDKYYIGQSNRDNVSIKFPLETTVKPLTVDGEDLLQVYTNTEHVVCEAGTPELRDEAALIQRGRALRLHRDFAPKGTNVNFMKGQSPDRVELQTYERGVENLTLACGTGAIATALAWHNRRNGPGGSQQTTVSTKGGDLSVTFDYDSKTGKYRNIRLEGPAERVFDGTFYL